MAIEISTNFHTDMVTKRTHNKIMRDVNRSVGRYIADKILPGKFSRTAFRQYPAAFKQRNPRYRRAKRAEFGSASPNVRTGKMKRYILTENLGHKLTATANRGRLRIKNYFPMPERQRQEMEALNHGDRANMAIRAQRVYLREINDPENQRKRRVKG